MKKKKYFVSLDAKKPVNVDGIFEAGNEKKAVEKAIKNFRYEMADALEINEDICSSPELDIVERSGVNDLGNGIWVEEVKN